jgi:hypothetical protein
MLAFVICNNDVDAVNNYQCAFVVIIITNSYRS